MSIRILMLLSIIAQFYAFPSNDCSEDPELCANLTGNFTHGALEPNVAEQLEALKEHLQLDNLTRKDEEEHEEQAGSSTTASIITESQLTTERSLNGSCDVEFKDLMIRNSEESFELEAGYNYRLRIDEVQFEKIKSVEWRKGRKPVNEYDWKKSCLEQRLAVDTDKKSLIMSEINTQAEEFTYFASAKVCNSSSILLFVVKLSVKKAQPPSVYTKEIIMWSCFGGGAVILLILLIIAHIIHLRYKKKQMRQREQLTTERTTERTVERENP